MTRGRIRRRSGTSTDRSVARSALFDPPLLLEGEDSAAYHELFTRISGALKPTDILEEIWVRDIVDLVWDANRLGRLKINLMKARVRDRVSTELEAYEDSDKLLNEWAAGTPEAIEEVNSLLSSEGLTMDAVLAETLSENLDDFERIERMIAIAVSRRNAALREIERHRGLFAHPPRETIKQIEGRDYQVAKNKAKAGEAA